MPTPKENIAKGEQLVKAARQREKCVAQADAVEDAINDLKDASHLSAGELLALAGLGLGVVGAVIVGFLADGPGLVGGAITIAGAGTAASGILLNVYTRVNKSNDKLSKAIARLEQCLSTP